MCSWLRQNEGWDADWTRSYRVSTKGPAPLRSPWSPIKKIRANPNQPRRDFEEDSLNELADSIRSSGVLQPILVRPVHGEEYLYELVAGERRWRASQIAELEEVPAMVRDLDDQESLAIALIENLQREDLNPIEEAMGLKRLQEQFSLTQEDLAERVGKSRSAIANTLRLMQLPDPIQMGHPHRGHDRRAWPLAPGCDGQGGPGGLPGAHP